MPLAALTLGDLNMRTGDVSANKGPKSEAGVRDMAIPKVIWSEVAEHCQRG